MQLASYYTQEKFQKNLTNTVCGAAAQDDACGKGKGRGDAVKRSRMRSWRLIGCVLCSDC